MNYRFHPDAASEHLETVAYYENVRPGLGARYLAEFERILAKVSRPPKRYPIVREPGIRRIRLQRFPFTILFRELDGAVEILAVSHYRRRPDYWSGRL